MLAIPQGVLYGKPDSSLYPSDVAKRESVGIEGARGKLGAIMQAAREQDIHTAITRHGIAEVVVVPVDWYREASESLGDPTDIGAPSTVAPPRRIRKKTGTARADLGGLTATAQGSVTPGSRPDGEEPDPQ